MNKETRIKKIAEILQGEPFGTQEIPWQDELEQMNVYKVPLEYLIYNKYNGRILSRTKSLERQNYQINPESPQGKALIEKLLWDTDVGRNQATQKNIEAYGQQKVGIITKDGVVIDGNRRVMLLNKIKKFDYFKTVILPVALEENPLAIEKLETIYQMGEDEKLSYNPIEKYLKTKGLKDRGISVEKIAEWMGETEDTIKKYLDVMEIMDEYLEFFEYDGIYTQLDKREGQLIDLRNWMKQYLGKESKDGFDGYTDSDVDDLKSIGFDYIRAKFEGKNFRIIANGRKGNHFFGNEGIWRKFRKTHFDTIPQIQAREEKIDYDSGNLQEHLNDRDNKYTKEALKYLEDNIAECTQQLGYLKAANEPRKLVESALDAITSINMKNENFRKEEVQDKVVELNRKTTELLEETSPARLFSRIIEMLESIQDSMDTNTDEDRELLLHEITQINRLSYEIKKSLGG